MDRKIFAKRLETYGSDFTRWPAGEAEEARRLTEDSAEARQLHREAQLFEGVLDGFEAPAPSPQLLQRAGTILEAPPRAQLRPVSGGLRERFERLFAAPLIPAGAVALAAVLVFTVLQPGGPETAGTGTGVTPPAEVAAVDRFLDEWEEMALAAARDRRQAEEIIGLLVVAEADTNTSPADDSGIEAFLDELEADAAGPGAAPLPDDIWNYFMDG